MTWEAFVFSAIVALGLVNFIHVGLYIAGANIYDIWQFRRKKLAANQENDATPLLPLVSVVIPAHNEERGVIQGLESVLANDYPNFEVIVVDDGSTDGTQARVQGLIERSRKLVYTGRNVCSLEVERRELAIMQPKARLKLVSQRNQGKAAAVNNGIRNHAKGSLIMTLDADSILYPDAISRAVGYFKDHKVAGVAANVRVMGDVSVMSLLQKFEHMIGYRSKKFYTMTNSEFIVGGVASTYRRSVLQQVNYYDTDTMTEDIGLSMKVAALGNTQNRLIYAADVVALTEGVQTFDALLRQRYRWKMGSLQNLFRHKHLLGNKDPRYSRMLTMYRLPMAFYGELMLLLQPFMLAYILYLSIAYQTTALFIGAYMVMTLYVLWTIWPDEHSNFRQKISLSLYTPILYFIFYLMDAIQVVSIFKCLIRPKLMLGLTQSESTWISPARMRRVRVSYS